MGCASQNPICWPHPVSPPYSLHLESSPCSLCTGTVAAVLRQPFPTGFEAHHQLICRWWCTAQKVACKLGVLLTSGNPDLSFLLGLGRPSRVSLTPFLQALQKDPTHPEASFLGFASLAPPTAGTSHLHPTTPPPTPHPAPAALPFPKKK